MSHHTSLPPEVDDAVRSFIRRHKRGLRWGCLAAALLALVLLAVAAWGLYRGAILLKDVVKDSVGGDIPDIRLPLEWEKPLGDSAMAQLRSQYQFVTDRQVLDPLNRLAAPLFAVPSNASDRFTLFVTTSKEINAFALPGGTIVFHRGLLERARTAEEIQGVLAHEMAHVRKRHGVLQLAQNVGLGLALQQLQGGENRMLDTLIRDSGQLLSLKFSRDHERAADDLGWELLEQARINPQGMVNFFAGLKAAAESSVAPVIPLLSTHPAPQERIDRLKQKAMALRPRDYQSHTQEFRDLQAGLGTTGPDITPERP
jgi:predicted Zn-dependent protease